LKSNQTYYFTNGTVKVADTKYTKIKNNMALNFN